MSARTEMPPIQYRTYIATSPARVYAAIATSEGWDSWFTTKATVDARADGSYNFYWENFGGDRETVTLSGPIVEAIPDQVFAYRWETGGDAMTTVRF